jgi:predicted permease
MQDLRDAFRALKATPVVTAVAVLSLALGIGANTAIFTILNSLLLRALPVHEPRKLAIVGLVDPGGGPSRTGWTNPIWEQVRERMQLWDGAMAWSSTRFNLAQGGQVEFVDGVWASGAYFDVLRVTPLLGRTFTAEDDRRGGGPDGPVTVISFNFWQRRFGGAANVIGQPLVVGGVPFTVVGVTPSNFFGTDVGRTFDVVIPIGTEPLMRGKESSLDRRSSWWLNIMVRFKPSQSIDGAIAALRGVQSQVREATIPENYRPEDKVRYLKDPFTLDLAATGSSGLRDRYQRPLTTIMVVVGLVLLIACANIANLLLARANARRHEISVRFALGASRMRLMRQLLTESLLLSGCGALLGLVFAQWGSRLLVRQLSTSTNNVFLDLTLDWRVLAFTSAVTVATATLFGIAPAFRASRVAPHEALKEQGRSGSTDRRFSLGNILVVVQVALSLVLVVAAGLFMRTFASLNTLNPGFDRDPVLVVNVNAQRLGLPPKERPALFEQLRVAVSSVAGVDAVASAVVTPVSGSTWQYRVEIPDGPSLPESERGAYVNLVSPSFFKAMGTRLIAGRDFTLSDRSGTPDVAIVNETFARKFFGGASPVGRRVRQPARPDRPETTHEVVGYVEDAIYRSLRAPVPPTLYLPVVQAFEPPSSISLVIRAAGGSPALLIKPVASALVTVNSNVALTFRPLKEQVTASLIQERLVAMLSGFFGGLALLLAGIGLYGVTSYAVSRRRTEIGIRMALGSAPGGVVRLVLQRVGLLVGLGVVGGAATAWYAAKFVSTLLYGVQPRDLVTLAAAAVILGAIGALAGWIPARRASRIDPAVVLRQ